MQLTYIKKREKESFKNMNVNFNRIGKVSPKKEPIFCLKIRFKNKMSLCTLKANF